MNDRAIDKLIKLKRDIEQAKLDKANAEGALQQCLDRLRIDFGCKTIEQAQKKLNGMKERQKELETEIEEALQELEDTYDV
jgi:predicted  nucleic acid-binding Zn-ribbon protein